MKYKDYLDEWEVENREAAEGSIIAYRYNKRFPITIHKLTEKEFNKKVNELDRLTEAHAKDPKNSKLADKIFLLEIELLL